MTIAEKRPGGVAMPYCQYCREEVEGDAVVCPKCGELLVGEGAGWQESQIQEKVDEAKHRANMCIISATVLVTAGIAAGWIVSVSSSAAGLFGIVTVCLGIGCTAAADRYEHKARILKEQLER
jgi:hypothetical protein